jgi:hypothetical protein
MDCTHYRGVIHYVDSEELRCALGCGKVFATRTSKRGKWRKPEDAHGMTKWRLGKKKRTRKSKFSQASNLRAK